MKATAKGVEAAGKKKKEYSSPDEQRVWRSDSSLKTSTGEITPCLTSGVENRN